MVCVQDIDQDSLKRMKSSTPGNTRLEEQPVSA